MNLNKINFLSLIVAYIIVLIIGLIALNEVAMSFSIGGLFALSFYKIINIYLGDKID